MNHHQFRVLVKETPIEIIKSYNINPAHFKAVCFTLSMYGDYETGTSIRPSWLTIAKEAGVDRKTAMKVRDMLISAGVLEKVKVNEANISEYIFTDKSEILDKQLSILDNQLSIDQEQLSIIEDQLSNIDGHNTNNNSKEDTTKDITFTVQEEVVESSLDYIERVSSWNKLVEDLWPK